MITDNGVPAVRTVRFNGTFRAANESRARYRVFCGGAGSGKSFNAAHDFILKLSDLRFRGANLLVVRKAESSCRGSVFAELLGTVRGVFGADAAKYWSVRQDPPELTSLVTGGKIVFRGMFDEGQRERVKSIAFENGKLTWIWCEEATELEPQDLEILDDRLRGDLSAVNPALYYQITLTFNPVSANHWLKRRFFDAPPADNVFVHRSTFGDNHFAGADFARRMEERRLTDPEGYEVYALGQWGRGRSGLILTRWRTDCLPQSPAAYDRCWLAQDFGFQHANCLLMVGMKDGTLCVLRESYHRQKDTDELIALAEAANFPRDLPMYCDSAEPDRIRTWRRHGFRAVPVVKGPGSVRAQIELLRSTEIVVDASCTNTIDELSAWCWLRDANGAETDDPVPVHDDAMAALRYAATPLLRPRPPLSKRSLGL